MKKFLSGMLCGGLMVGLCLTALAENTQRIEAVFGRVKLLVNGKALNEETLLYNNTTYVPLRAAAEALNVAVEWDGNTQTAKLNNDTGAVVAPVTTTTDPVTTPTLVYIYKDNRSPENHYPDIAFMGSKSDGSDGSMTIETDYKNNPYSGSTCVKI